MIYIIGYIILFVIHFLFCDMLRANTEFILNLDQFRNSELFQPGIYNLKFSIYHEDSEKIHYAQPESIMAQEDQDSAAMQEELR